MLPRSHFAWGCVTLCQYFVGFYFMYTVVSNLSSVIVTHYLLNVSARCQINLLALNSLRLPSFELSWCWFLVKFFILNWMWVKEACERLCKKTCKPNRVL